MGTTTPNLGLYVPTDGERVWGSSKVSYNFTLIDGAFVTMEAALAAHSGTGKHNHLQENTSGHGIVFDHKIETAIPNLGALGDELTKLIMVLGG